MKTKVLRTLRKINITHSICHHLLGKEHTTNHRMAAGAIVMSIGVLVSKVHFEVLPMLHYFMDGLGYFIHGLGAVPFIEHFICEEEKVIESFIEADAEKELVEPEES